MPTQHYDTRLTLSGSQCLILYLKLGDTAKEAHSLYTIGLLAASPALHDRQTAFNYLQQARVLFRRRGDRAEEGDVAYQLGKVCVARRAYEPAVRYFEEVRRTADYREELNARLDVCCAVRLTGLHPLPQGFIAGRRGMESVPPRARHAQSPFCVPCARLLARGTLPHPLALDDSQLTSRCSAQARKLFADAPASDERHAEGSCLLRIAEILSGDVGGDAAEREGLKDEVRAREYYDQVRAAPQSHAFYAG